MITLSEHIGGRIRLYRKNKMMSLDQLSARINKSKSTVSKYERGTVAIDVETLFEIAAALNIAVAQLIDYGPADAQNARKHDAKQRIFDGNNFYLYYYSGRKKDLIRGFFEVREDPLESDSRAVLFLGFDSFAQYNRCNYLYSGRISSYDTLTRISMTNQANPVEEIVFNILDTLGHEDQVVGHMSGMLNNPFQPVSMKCILSATRLEEDAALIAGLKLTGEDWKNIRKLNMFTVTQPY